jgi:hypothetical protein
MKYLVLVTATVALTGCATSMTPSQFMEEFPMATKSEFYGRADAKEALGNNTCKLLVAERRYVAPQGLTVDGDLHHGARGVDEWVRIDGGNAYGLDSFEWVTVGDEGGTQLIVYFDTLLC